MEVQKLERHGESCNFCSRGKLSNGGYNLSYPYNYVYEVTGTGIKVRFCPDCAKSFNDLIILEEIK
jgi:hypothetical protein